MQVVPERRQLAGQPLVVPLCGVVERDSRFAQSLRWTLTDTDRQQHIFVSAARLRRALNARGCRDRRSAHEQRWGQRDRRQAGTVGSLVAVRKLPNFVMLRRIALVVCREGGEDGSEWRLARDLGGPDLTGGHLDLR
jgi:hypothetical protein